MVDLKIELVLGDTNTPEEVAEQLRENELHGHPFEWAAVDSLHNGLPIVRYTVHSMEALAGLLAGYLENVSDEESRDQVFSLLRAVEVDD